VWTTALSIAQHMARDEVARILAVKHAIPPHGQ
jgi:hypothetical protein